MLSQEIREAYVENFEDFSSQKDYEEIGENDLMGISNFVKGFSHVYCVISKEKAIAACKKDKKEEKVNRKNIDTSVEIDSIPSSRICDDCQDTLNDI